ncbi:MFS transporter [Microtetraspora sp. AC03309]|uniref:MFS transporter n=1 Tax=Microtetraspora sp. AC03309 TaxID=2779376 RepID=UPI001E5F2E89|nr:MFS transporter [Microtetraspora sp. AC03309]MCC5577179.1 MFS transporter [Microtetraspora sp. AC03309]
MGALGIVRRPLTFWIVGVFAYIVAVFHRQSLGVSAIDATARFGIGATGLSLLAMLQLLVYAAMQIPVGVLVDRLGSKKMIIIGAAVMAAGQVVFALADGLLGAVAGRILIGSGDALTFISVIRIVNLWFPARRNPLIVQITAQLGQVGAIVSAVPLISSLHSYGWTPTFLGAAALSVLVLVSAVILLRDRRPDATTAGMGVRAAWAHPGTRLGMWTHAATQCSSAAFTMLWGYPYLVESQGLSPQAAGLLITTLTVLSMTAGPLLGYLAGRFPFHRSRMVLIVIGATAAAWTAVLLWPGHAPQWVLVLLVVVLATNGPGSAIGFDYARTFNPTERIGVATGIVNSGGFAASMTVITTVGVLVDLVGDYRWAFAVQYPIWLLGAVQVVRYRVRARRLQPAPAPALNPNPGTASA